MYVQKTSLWKLLIAFTAEDPPLARYVKPCGPQRTVTAANTKMTHLHPLAERNEFMPLWQP